MARMPRQKLDELVEKRRPSVGKVVDKEERQRLRKLGPHHVDILRVFLQILRAPLDEQ